MLEKVSLSNLMPFIYADHEVTNIIMNNIVWKLSIDYRSASQNLVSRAKEIPIINQRPH
jgi:hypothetical protein